MRHLFVAAIVATACGAVAHARADEVIAVVITAEQDRDVALADNLTEVAMAKLSDATGARLVGVRELRERLARASIPTSDCLTDEACVRRISGVRTARVLLGTIDDAGRGYRLVLSMNLSGGRSVCSREVTGGVGPLIGAVQACIDELRAPVRVPSSPPRVVQALPERLSLAADQAPLSTGLERRPAVGYASGIAAAVCLSAGAVLGVLASGVPSGDSRRDAEADLQRRQTYGSAATALLGTGVVMAIISVGTFYELLRHGSR